MAGKELIFVIITCFTYCYCTSSRKIPDHLLECYYNGSTSFSSPKSIQSTVELLSTIERYHMNSNIRTVSTSLLHYLKLDGIERGPNIIESENVIPYRASAFQYTKFSFLMDLLIPSQSPWKLPENIPANIVCGIHYLISSSVHPWQRGDEDKICPLRMPKDGIVTKEVKDVKEIKSARGVPKTSRCPIEKGVIKTGWGDVSFGAFVSGVAAGLERQDVKTSQLLGAMLKNRDEELNDESEFNIESRIQDFEQEVRQELEKSDPVVSNLLVATIVGDLAELAIRQGPYARGNASLYSFGPPGRWNDSLVPRDFVMMSSSPIRWEMTDAEILGAIDGLIVGEYINAWTSFRANVRLSQIAEMYYSNYGIPFGDGMRACNRRQNFAKIISTYDIYQQTLAVVNLLWTRLSNVYVGPKEIEEITRVAVKAFEDYWPKVLEGLPGCNVNGDANQMEIVLVTDQTWSKYETIQFISSLTEKLDVSYFGSTMGLIHGTTGEWVSPISNSTIELHENIANASNMWIRRLDLPAVLTTIIEKLGAEANTTSESLVAFPRVVILAAPSSKWSSTELDRARQIMDDIRANYMDVYFLYVTPDSAGVQYLGQGLYEFTDVHLETEDKRPDAVAEKIRSNFVEKVLPMRIVVPQCDKYNFLNQYEDYISVGQKIVYRIHPRRLMVVDTVKIYFQGVDQGEISVCISRKYSEDAADSCKIISDNRDARFHLDDPCKGREPCDPVYFIVRARSTKVNCADKSCRYPNHIRYTIRHTGLACDPSKNSGSIKSYDIHRAFAFALFSFLYLMLMNKLADDDC